MNNTYIHTGKINPAKTVLALVIGIPCAYIIGLIYAALSSLCPFIILDFLILVIPVLGILGLTTGLVRIGTVRNKAVKGALAFIVSTIVWYSSWAYLVHPNNLLNYSLDISYTLSQIADYLNTHSFSIGKFTSSSKITIEGAGMWIFALLEIIIFGLSVWLTFAVSKDYFCEECGKFNDDKEFYLEDANEAFFTTGEQTGKFKELNQFTRKDTLPEANQITDYKKEIYKVELSWCGTCKKNGVINVEKGVYEKDDKGKISFTGKDLLKDILVSDDSARVLFVD